MARGFKVADAYVELTIDKDELRRGAAGIPAAVGPEMDRAGKDMGKRLGKSLGDESSRQGTDAGGKLALGMRMSIIRNSPLIVAAVGAALAVGGPAMMTAATGLFAGIGIVAAAQSQKVQAAWVGTWNKVKNAAILDAHVIEPVLVNMAGAVGKAFERMRPLIRDAFVYAAPQIAVFTKGLTDLAENALPGMVRAVERGLPVTKGFADFLAKTGTGLSDFFDRISSHGPAAGQVWSSLGDIMGELLPILGELLGQGAELAATVLPMLSGALRAVLTVVDALGPALPIIIAGFTAMKIVGTISPMLANLSTNLATAAANGGIMSGVAGKMTGAVSGLSSAVGPLSVGIAAWAGIFQYSQAQITKWTAALNEGGDAAAKAKQDMAGYDEGIGKIGTVLDTTAAKTNIFTASTAWAWELLSNDTDEAREASERYLASLTPVEKAQRQVGIASDYLATQIEKYGAGSNEAEGASRALKAAQGDLEDQNGKLEMAIEGVTQAMIDQANQAMSAIDKDFAYQNSLDQLEDKQRAYTEAIRDHGRASEEASDAQRGYSEGIWDTAKAAAEADPMLDGLEEGTKEYDRAVQNLTLQSLVAMRSGLGPEMQVVVDGMIAKLQAGGASLDELGNKKPKPVVDADTNPLKDKVTAANHDIDVLNGRRPLPGLDLNTGPFNGKTQTSFGLLDVLNGKRPTPIAGLNANPLFGTANAVNGTISNLNGRRADPWAFLHADTAAAERALNWAARNRTMTVLMTTANQRGLAAGGKVGGPRRFDIGGSPSRRSDGRISGPGGPLDDLVPAITSMGEAIRVANSEWIINGAVSARMGDRKMAALNAGRADIVPRRFDRGGSPDDMNRPGAGGGSTVIINISGTFDLASSRDLRRVATTIHSELKQIERSLS